MRRGFPLVAGPVVAALLVVFLLVVYLVGGDAPAGGPRLDWRPVRLPLAGARAVLRDVLRCGGNWYALGSRMDGSVTRPAVWRSPTGRHWHPLRIAPHTPYGHRHTLYAGGCRNGRIAALGAAIGGRHGMPRTSNWYQRGGTMIEVRTAAELYGGESSVAVSRLAGGPAGWLASGDWLGPSGRAGAAVWWSRGGVTFHRVAAGDLVSGTGEQTTAADAIAAPGGGWLLVGSRYRFGSGTLAENPVWWTSADGRGWRRHPVPGDGAFQRVTTGPRGTVAVGAAGTGFAAWRRTGAGWHRLGAFDPSAGTDAEVQAVAAVPAGLLVTAPAAGRLSLWASATGAGWTRLPTPVTVPAGAETRMLVAGSGGTVLLAVDTGHGSRLWLAHPAGTGLA